MFLEKTDGLQDGMIDRRYFQFGILLGFAFLARLDTALVSASLFTYLVIRSDRDRLRSGAFFLVGAGLSECPTCCGTSTTTTT